MLHQNTGRLLEPVAKPKFSEQSPISSSNHAQFTRNSNVPPLPASHQAPSSSLTSSSPPPTSHVSTSLLGNTKSVPATVLLQTAVVKVSDINGHTVWARALLDPASQINLITEELSQQLTLRRIKTHQEIGGVGNSTVVSSHIVIAKIKSHCSTFIADFSFHVLSGITRELPARALATAEWTIPNEIVLADPTFYQPGRIDMILGMEVYYELIQEGLVRLGPHLPVLQKTTLGWVVSGKVGNSSAPTLRIANICTATAIDEQLARFWEIESCYAKSTLSVEETLCEAHFAATTVRNEMGRFVVQLPKRNSVLATLGNSEEIAIRRFLALERRLNANPPLKEAYSNFIDEYYRLGHMVEPSAPFDLPSYFLPHHCVIKPDSLTTKLRVVFDASCATDTGVSLNDALMIGPVVQDDLLSIVLRFRMHRYAIIADVEKMYRQVAVHSPDRALQQILWRNSPQEPLRTYQLTTVTYGTSCAPYLATKCLQELSKSVQNTQPKIARIVGSDFYMDDLLTGVDDICDGQQLCSQLLNVLNSAGFPLRKWSSNCPMVLEHLPPDILDERQLFELDSSSAAIKTLGLQWQTNTDQFIFGIPKWNESTVITKRTILSDAAKLFDPLGLVGPVIVRAKICMQDLWRDQKTWDEPLSEEFQERWREFKNSLTTLQDLIIPRWAIQVDSPSSIEIHGFCDSSEKAYGACIYLRAIAANGTIAVNLLTAKSKVAPLGDTKKQKRICLPRLELSSALLLAHLFQKVQHAIRLNTKPFFWTDSTIVLHWLAATPSRWKTFVANRVSEIQHITASGIWSHVSGSENPADIISRGMDPEQLQHTSTWWHGPDWLSKQPRFWPSLSPLHIELFDQQDLEERPITLVAQPITVNSIFSLRSSYMALVRIVAWMQRFCYNSQPKNLALRRNGCLRVPEIKEAEKTLVRIAQSEIFSEDLSSIAKTGQVKPNSQLKLLTPLVCQGILRVRGRLQHAAVSYDRKHPMILPAKHPLTDLIARYYHEKLLHAGPQFLIAGLREKFWPLRIRNLVRRTVHSCISCFRCRPRVQDQIMGDLPPERVSPTLPFVHTGVDLCGPLYYRHPQRRSQHTKTYIAIFVCLSVKAIHIELVGDLSTGSFIAALRRFLARRGKPRLIECDNATNFKGASRELAELKRQFNSQQMQQSITSSCTEEGIEFKFIPPRSPNFGGLWEAAVRSLKAHLRATIGNAVLTAEQLTTLLAQIESCLNSRPLTQMTAEPEDLEVLTPGHFLIHRSLTAPAEPSLENVPINRLDRWQVVQEYVRRLWRRWSTEYLSGLQPRTKWTREKDNIAIGTMVLVKEENLPPLKWRFGRIVHIFRADDGNIRVVVVRTKDGEFRRAISKICVLPIRQPSPPNGSHDNDDN
ncbi:uncharacterized protein LOC128741071 [Sabethes cyaneus]|uniref:uncharacterized protein LOC128741071 n=1 Tax=Sabethes cyaneus TaxID=53552 RepID=UPI00237E2027|nr:uncharacterized protein LOC128741071 [Sabethes cyaneus]